MFREIVKRVRMPVGMKVAEVKVEMNYNWRRSQKEVKGEGEEEVEDTKRKTRIGVKVIGENLPKVIRGE